MDGEAVRRIRKKLPHLCICRVGTDLASAPEPVELARLLHNFLVYRDCVVGIVLAWLAVCVSM